MKRRWIAIILSVCMLSLSACSSSEELEPGNGKWRDSDINGSVKAEDEIRPQDDFAAAANKEWILEHGDNGSTLIELMKTVYDKKQAVLDDPSLNDKTARELKKFAAFASDKEARDAAGVEPLRKYIDEIQSLESRDDIFSYMADPERNPLGASPVKFDDRLKYSPKKYPGKQAVCLSPSEVSMEDSEFYYNLTSYDLEEKEIHEGRVNYLLGRLDYDKSQIKAILRGNYRLEKKIITSRSNPTPGQLMKKWWSKKELLDLTSGYPMEQYIDGWGFSDCDRFCGDKRFLKKLGRIMNGSSPEDIRAFLIVRYLNASFNCLDTETKNKIKELNKPRMTVDEPVAGDLLNNFKDQKTMDQYELFDEAIGNSGMMAAMDKLYLEKYYDEKVADNLHLLTEWMIAGLRKVFREEDWLSKKGKNACFEKLDAININIVRPNTEDVDYSDLNIVPEEEGGNYMDAVLAAQSYKIRKLADRVEKPCDREYWDPYDHDMTTTQTNAFYHSGKNAIYVLQGIAEEPAYNISMPTEEKLGMLGVIIGHELTHGFDASGAQFDKNGNNKKWLPQEDMMEFEVRTADVANYYSLITPYKNADAVNGDKINEEATADMGGMKAALRVAEKIEGFDYDRFFRAYASFYATQRGREDERAFNAGDEHPLAYLRVNVGVQQFDEFIKTYDVKPKDKMYLEKKKRIAVW